MTPSPLSISALAPHPPLRRYYANEQAKAGFVRRIFDAGAGDYDRVERLMALGSGSWYRRMALQRAGLAAGMRVLDVAIGTGLVAREEVAIVGSPQLVLGLDPSVGMVQEAVQHLGLPVIIGRAERLPLGDELFDFLSMGYALRHISDLRSAFGEFRRVLKPGGTLCILEITRPRKEWTAAILRQYMLRIVPALARLMGRAAQSVRLWEYFWDTIEACVPAEQVMAALTSAGFVRVRREKNMGIFSQYIAQRE
jgi:demethylmenaquinone methyltransferase/2-methoxy-6-polyprenyl-1,4-benzoquinol methylase